MAGTVAGDCCSSGGMMGSSSPAHSAASGEAEMMGLTAVALLPSSKCSAATGETAMMGLAVAVLPSLFLSSELFLMTAINHLSVTTTKKCGLSG